MKSLILRLLMCVILAAVCFWGVMCVYFHVAAISAAGGRVAYNSFRWDVYVWAAVAVLSVAAIVGVMLKASWARLLALIMFGASGSWAVAVALAPQHLLQRWFSTWTDNRWSAGIAASIIAVAFGWLCTRQARNEFRYQRAST